AELDRTPGYVSDPLQEGEAGLAPGLLKKYAHRALMITTEACAVHCRYCFRREFPYADQQGDLGRWREAISAIAADSSIREVILSGGDPLSLTNARLKSLTDVLRGIGHIEWLRIHTRNAIVLPSRVDEGFIEWIASLPWRVTVVLHVNHANELQGDAADAISKLRSTGALLLNQAVLLRGVNDEAEALIALSKRLHDLGIAPYYLHLLDRVNGTAHFEVSEARGKELVTAMAEALPGFLVPKLAREIPRREAKTVLAAGL
ncbi:MAG: KamA family radical SAM protein, partial [Steroidobacteraceae bacterium]